jgi:hypothetical protein
VTCVEAEACLVDAVDGRLDAPTGVRLYAHLDGCAACRERAALWRALVPGMRALAPAPPDAMQARRMQLEVERRLSATLEPAPRRRWPARAALAAVAVTAVAAGLLAPLLRGAWRARPEPAAFAVAVRVVGTVSAGGRPLSGDARLGVGAEVELAAEAEAELAVGRASSVRITGPGRVTLGGDARAVAIELARGTLEAAVDHRQDGETFAVVTHDARVEVRGTRFSVGAGAAGSWVRVREGRVEVHFSDGRVALVSAGEAVSSAPAARAVTGPDAPATAPSAPGDPIASIAPTFAARASTSCAEARRSCRSAAQAARASMRAGAYARALGLLGAPAVAGRDAPVCDGGLGDCADELGYLRAEALRLSNRFDAAIAAYKALDRRGAPAPMRQNALYAAAQLEQRQGLIARAGADYERALAAAPRGALHEEALLGAMEAVAAAGDTARASSLARRYLDELPDGRGAAAARRLLIGDPRP